MIAFIDNYDSFTYNLVQFIGEVMLEDRLGDPHQELRVWRNDQTTVEALAELKPDHIIISPGPGTPQQDSGISNDVIRHFYKSTPILGVCLGTAVHGPRVRRGRVPGSAADARQGVAGLPHR